VDALRGTAVAAVTVTSPTVSSCVCVPLGLRDAVWPLQDIVFFKDFVYESMIFCENTPFRVNPVSPLHLFITIHTIQYW